MNTTITEYLQSMRLVTTRDSVVDTAMDSGFGSICCFNRILRRKYAVTPREYRRRGG